MQQLNDSILYNREDLRTSVPLAVVKCFVCIVAEINLRKLPYPVCVRKEPVHLRIDIIFTL